MPISKKARLASLFIVVLLVTVIIVLYRNIGEDGITPGEPTTRVPTPNIPKQFEDYLSISFEVDENDFNFPDRLPTIAATLQQITESQGKSIAFDLNFSFEPLVFEDVKEGTKYIWRGDEASLIITQKSGEVEYRLNSTEIPEVADEKLSDGSIIQTAENFLVDSFGFNQENLSPASISYLFTNPSSEGFSESQIKSNADVFQVSFTLKSADYKILTVSPDQPLIFVRILPNGAIYQATAVLLEETQTSQDTYPIKNYEEVKDQIDEAILVSIRNDYVNIRDLTRSDIRSLVVDTVSIAYLFDSSTSRIRSLQPVFLLEGDVEVSNSTANRALLYLPAIRNP
ncbi:MAG: hypothetical protein PVJ52_00055 [Candidatus Woesebacteria bacterium]|jgi:hypothetical protein